MRSTGLMAKEILVCDYVSQPRNRGIWYGDNPFNFTSSLLILQIVVIFAITRITHMLLSPLRQTMLVAQILAGIIMGPSFLGQYKACFEKLFPWPSRMTLSTFAEFGIIVHFFKIGVQVNPKQILKIERQAMVIGLVGYALSLIFACQTSKIVRSIVQMGTIIEAAIPAVAVGSSMTSFVAVSSFLNELNILNSEIGRLALSTSMITDASAWIMYFVVYNVSKALALSSYMPVLKLLATFSYFAFLFFLLRPLVIWISHRNPHGKPMTHGHFLAIICVLLFVALSAQFAGQPAFLGAFLFGLVLPDGPPLGSVLAERLDVISSNLLVPAYCTISGLKTGVDSLANSKSLGLELIILAGYVGKFAGTILPSLYFQIHLWDSFALACIMCCKGIVDLLLSNIVFDAKIIGPLPFTLLIYNMVLITGLSTIVIYNIYDPSRRYRGLSRRTIMESEEEIDFRILVCVHDEENVYPMINLLQASNPTKATPLSVFVLHLMELTGSAASVLARSESSKMSSSTRDFSNHIISAFDQFEQRSQGHVAVQNFTVIAPYASMHDDICFVAMDTRSSIVIVPFHKQTAIDGNMEVFHASIRKLNQNVLNKAPCSVGVLIGRSQKSGELSVISENSYYQIGMLFLGGADDQEALAYSMRMAKHPSARLTVIWVRAEEEKEERLNMEHAERELLMEDIRYSGGNEGKVVVKEERVKDAEKTTQIIRMMDGKFNLVIVGKQHSSESPCTLGLMAWSENPELGPIGDMLASSDFTFSVLVVQQQPLNARVPRYLSEFQARV